MLLSIQDLKVSFRMGEGKRADRSILAIRQGRVLEKCYRFAGLNSMELVGRVARRDASGTSGVVEATAPHAVFVEDDTRAHEIRPRRASALRWEQGGEVHFARVVRHPGTKGKPFMGPAAIKAEAALYAKMHERTAAAVARASR